MPMTALHEAGRDGTSDAGAAGGAAELSLSKRRSTKRLTVMA